YIQGLRPVQPGEYFSTEWGPMHSRGPWAEYAFDAVKDEIEQRAGVSDVQPINEAVNAARSAFDSGRDDILPALDAILSQRDDGTLKNLRDEIAKLKDHFSMEDFANRWIPRGTHIVRDPRAQGGGNFQIPHHMRYQAWLLERASFGNQAEEMAKLAMQA